MSKICIILYTFFSKNNIERILNSLSVQSLKDFECFIVDGGSKDGTLSIVKSYTMLDNRFMLVNASNIWQGYNLVLNNYNSEYCMFLDTSYTLHDSFLDDLYKQSKKYDADIVIGNNDFEHVGNELDYTISLLDSTSNATLYGRLIKTSIIGNIRFENYGLYTHTLFMLRIMPDSLIYVSYKNIRKITNHSLNCEQLALNNINASNSLDGLLAIMNYIQLNKKTLELQCLEYIMINTIDIVNNLTNSKTSKNIKIYAKNICRAYVKWFIQSNRVPLSAKINALTLCISYRLYKLSFSVCKKLAHHVARHSIYKKSRWLRANSKHIDREY